MLSLAVGRRRYIHRKLRIRGFYFEGGVCFLCQLTFDVKLHWGNTHREHLAVSRVGTVADCGWTDTQELVDCLLLCFHVSSVCRYVAVWISVLKNWIKKPETLNMDSQVDLQQTGWWLLWKCNKVWQWINCFESVWTAELNLNSSFINYRITFLPFTFNIVKSHYPLFFCFFY